MVATVGSIRVLFEGQFGQYVSALQKADLATGRFANRADRNAKSVARSWRETNSAMAGFGRSMITALAAGASVQGMQRLIDTATRIRNALKVAGLSGDELSKVYGRLFDAAQKNAVPVEALATLYGRAAQQQNELGVSSEQLISFTSNVALALRVAGTDAQTASGALLQLGQALGSGTVHAEEFNSILEGAPTIAQAAAAGIEEAGGSVAKLKQLVVDGKLSSKAFFDGFAAGSETLAERAAGAETTISGSFVRLQNVMVDTAMRFDDQVHVTRILANAINTTLIPAIKEMGSIANWAAEGPIGKMYTAISDTIDKITQLSADFGAMTGLDQIGGNPYIGQQRIQDRITGAFAGTNYTAPKGDRGGTELTVDKGTVTKPITLADYPVTGGGKGGGKSAGQRADDYERLTKRIVDSTAATVAETEAQRGLNPLVNDYGYAVEKARVEQDLLTAAQNAGKEITPQLRTEIAALAEQYATATAETAKLSQSQDQLRETAAEWQSFSKDMLGGFISDLMHGKSASDALADALGKVADKLLDIALNDLFSGSGGGGLFGSLFSGLGSLFGGGAAATTSFLPGILSGALVGLFHEGGYVGNPSQFRSIPLASADGLPRFHSGAGIKHDELMAVLQRNENVITAAQTGRIAGALGASAETLKDGGQYGRPGSLPVHVTVGWSRTADGNLKPFVEKVAQGEAVKTVGAYDQNLPDRVQQIHADPRAR